MKIYHWLKINYPHIADEYDNRIIHPYFIDFKVKTPIEHTTSKVENDKIIVCGYCETKNKNNESACISCGAPLDDYVSVGRNKPEWCL